MTTPNPGATALTQAAASRYFTLSDLALLARPDCPACNGIGWTTERSAVPFIGGLSAVPCGCTVKERGNG